MRRGEGNRPMVLDEKKKRLYSKPELTRQEKLKNVTAGGIGSG